MWKPKVLGVVGVLSTALAMMAWGQQPPAEKSRNAEALSGLMRAKLASSQKLVEGLVARDFDLIRKGAEEMTRICDATEWRASDDQIYAHYRAELRRTGKKLILLAEESNLDGVAYTYMHSLTNCVSCHEHCRDVLHIATRSDFDVIQIPATAEDNVSGPSRELRR